MVSGDRQVAVGARGPFFAMQREFSRHFERIDVLCPRPDKPVTVREIFERVHVHPAECGRFRMVDFIASKGRELIAAHAHSLIVSHDYGWFYNGLGSAKLSCTTGVPYISEIHHVPGHPIAANKRELFDRAVARRYVRWARAHAKAFRVVNSVEMPQLLESWGVPREQIAVLPSLYIDLATFSPPPQPLASEHDIAFVGRMVDNKGLDRIVDALAVLAKRGKKLRALFVGKGPLLADTQHRARQRGIAETTRFIEWLAQPEELAHVYRTSRTVVCASTCEGGPRFTVEAMACATPIVSTPVGMMKELLREGENGALCGFDVESLAAAIERVLADEPRRVQMGARARLDSERFEYTRILRGYADGLKQLAGESS